jgi:PKD repeat protein
VTKNQGQTWSKVIKPVDKDGGVAPSYTRTQAWYDLSIAVDPNNDSTLVVGGVDLFKSVTGGKSWTQLSHWYGGFSLPNVHADQHTAVFRPGSSDEILFGNDGGVFYTANLTATKPSFLSKNDDYNVTQFYGCALHPGLGSSYCLAGAQDNGSWKFTTPGINTTISASGGDGCFCFIDQDEPNIQLTSYVYNTFYVSTNGGGNFGGTVLSDGNSGSFVNASDYDDVQNILYTYKTASQLYRVTGVGKSPSPSVGTIASSFGSTVTHIRVSPYAPVGTSTVFVGNAAGRVYKVTNANTAAFVNTPLTTPGAGNISCIEIGASEDELLVTMSNYGVKSVYYSIDGGKTWLNKEGNLPDMPVRWALFNPNDRKQVILATEVGVWATDDITAEIPQWSPANNGLANVRVDMLQIRKSDNTVIAATHGRGLFSTDAFTITNAQPVADFNAVMVTPCEGSGVTFKNTSTGIITSYLWDFGAGATPATDSTAGPINVTYSSTGFKSVTLTVKGPGGATISLKSFTINTNPAKPIITQNLNTLSTATTGVIYQWLNNGSTISGATKQTYSATVSSTYTVKVTDNNGCTSMSDPYNFIYSGINTLSADFGIVIFPIPASNEVNVQFNQIRANSLSIVNLKGQVVFEKQQVNEVEKLAISELASGVYLLKLKLMNGKEVVQKLVIKQ